MSVADKIEGITCFVEKLHAERVPDSMGQGKETFNISVSCDHVELRGDRRALKFRYSVNITPREKEVFLRNFSCQFVFSIFLRETVDDEEMHEFMNNKDAFHKRLVPYASGVLASVTSQMGLSPFILSPEFLKFG